MPRPKRPTNTHRTSAPTTGSLRIIGGQWRSRKLQFQAAEGLRPSGDRIRETLFNWLAPHIEGAYCLDLFAGSGALGLEALSRGAEDCDFVEMHTGSARQIGEHLRTLKAENGKVINRDAVEFINNNTSQYDIIFLDPPFNKGLIEAVIPVLQNRLKNNGLIYIETAKNENITIPTNWEMIREKSSGDVRYGLWGAI